MVMCSAASLQVRTGIEELRATSRSSVNRRANAAGLNPSTAEHQASAAAQ